ncbi:MAG: 50S ribosomal protein L35 [Candidatus Paceibacterota bacterium]|nr:MAG: 50S ribosomal protein L35 [Candidatus Paceibacterota bacterium]
MKTNKSYTKRLKVTRKGKVIARKTGQNHFNSKDSGRKGIAKRRSSSLKFNKRISRRFLSK